MPKIDALRSLSNSTNADSSMLIMRKTGVKQAGALTQVFGQLQTYLRLVLEPRTNNAVEKTVFGWVVLRALCQPSLQTTPWGLLRGSLCARNYYYVPPSNLLNSCGRICVHFIAAHFFLRCCWKQQRHCCCATCMYSACWI